MSVPKWILGYLQTSDLKKIENAVASAELKTIGELVPVVVRKSSTVGHVPFYLLFVMISIFFVLDLDHLQLELFDGPLELYYAIDFLLLMGLTRFLSPLPFVQRIFIPKSDRNLQVEQRALIEFYDHQVHQTDESTGILIFVSLMERQAVVLGDESISSKLKPEAWDEVIEKLIKGVKTKNLADGLIAGIEASGELLIHHFPKKPGNKNELKNHLIIKE